MIIIIKYESYALISLLVSKDTTMNKHMSDTHVGEDINVWSFITSAYISDSTTPIGWLKQTKGKSHSRRYQDEKIGTPETNVNGENQLW